jgi:hypothetical protein
MLQQFAESGKSTTSGWHFDFLASRLQPVFFNGGCSEAP